MNGVFFRNARLLTTLAILALSTVAYSNDNVDKGDDAFAQGRYADAIRWYTAYIDDNPFRGYMRRCHAYGLSGRIESAIQDATRAISLAPKRDDAYEARAYWRMKNGDYAAAIADYTKAISLSESGGSGVEWRAGLHEARGNVYNSTGDVESAVSDWRSAFDLDRGYPQGKDAQTAVASRMQGAHSYTFRVKTLYTGAPVAKARVGILMSDYVPDPLWRGKYVKGIADESGTVNLLIWDNGCTPGFDYTKGTGHIVPSMPLFQEGAPVIQRVDCDAPIWHNFASVEVADGDLSHADCIGGIGSVPSEDAKRQGWGWLSIGDDRGITFWVCRRDGSDVPAKPEPAQAAVPASAAPEVPSATQHIASAQQITRPLFDCTSGSSWEVPIGDSMLIPTTFVEHLWIRVQGYSVSGIRLHYAIRHRPSSGKLAKRVFSRVDVSYYPNGRVLETDYTTVRFDSLSKAEAARENTKSLILPHPSSPVVIDFERGWLPPAFELGQDRIATLVIFRDSEVTLVKSD